MEDQNNINSIAQFTVRGVVQGYYGREWSLEEWELLIRVMHKKRQNFVLYGPKLDTYHRDQWRTDYPAEKAEFLQKIMKMCITNGINFGFSISPGKDFKFDSQEDYDIIVRKLLIAIEWGVSSVAILMDDIARTLENRYKSAFGTIGRAQSHLVRTIKSQVEDQLAQIQPGRKLTWMFCPTHYRGNEWEHKNRTKEAQEKIKYWEEINREIPLDVMFMFTGHAVVASTVMNEYAKGMKKFFGKRRKFILWDNYPVNDYNSGLIPFLQPYVGRGNELPQYFEGVLANPMQYIIPSLFALETIFEYLDDPVNYDPYVNWEHCIAEILEIFPSQNNNNENHDKQLVKLLFDVLWFAPCSKLQKPELPLSYVQKLDNKPLLELQQNLAILQQHLPSLHPQLIEHLTPVLNMITTFCNLNLAYIAYNVNKNAQTASEVTAALRALDALLCPFFVYMEESKFRFTELTQLKTDDNAHLFIELQQQFDALKAADRVPGSRNSREGGEARIAFANALRMVDPIIIPTFNTARVHNMYSKLMKIYFKGSHTFGG